MKALRSKEGNAILADVTVPHAPGEALVRVILSGICNTDLEIVKGYSGFHGTIGHEFVGVVEESSQSDLAGERVVGEINAGCGFCELCIAGDPRHCARRTVLGIVGRDGAHAEYLTLPIRNLQRVPAAVSDREAVFVEPLAAALAITERVTFDKSVRVAIIGDGKLGLLCAQALAATGAQVTLMGKHANKLEIASRMGIQTVLLSEFAELKKEFDVVVEASGNPGGFNIGLDLLRPRGTLVLKSTFHGQSDWDAARVVIDEITIVGSRCGRFAPALDLLASRRVDVESLISEEYPLDKGVEALDRAAQPSVLKVLLRP